MKTGKIFKMVTTLCVIALLDTNLYAQATELENFQKQLNAYINFTLGKKGALPLNAANQVKFRKKVDETFKTFVLHKDSYGYDKYVVVKNDEKTKFLRLDDRVTVYITHFLINKKTYVVYSYTSVSKRNYYIKENESNRVVYEGNSTTYLIDNLYPIDDKHFLLIEKNGDFNSSRSAVVLLVNAPRWTKIKAFEGKAFGQVPADYFNKKFVKRRTEFQLVCEMDFTFSAPADVNSIFFDPATKTISYKQYAENKKFKLVTAKWENDVFVIDDYNVEENLPAGGIAVPG